MTQPHHATLFDLDGTLVDLPVAPGAIMRLRRKLHRLCLRHDINLPFRPLLSDLETATRMVRDDHGEEKADALKERAFRMLDKIELRAVKSSTLLVGADQVLDKLARQPLGLVTSTGRAATDAVLEHLGIDRDIFSTIVTRDDPVPAKPSPVPLVRGIEDLRVRWPHLSTFTYVGDHVFDIQCAKMASRILRSFGVIVRSVAVVSPRCRRRDLEREKPDTILDCLSELLRSG